MAVYFIRAGESGPVKIGYATNVAQRLVKMQSDAADDLFVIGVDAAGSKETEREYHARFATEKIRGEWFSPSAQILETAAQLGVPAPEVKRRKWETVNGVVARFLAKNRMTLCEFARMTGVTQATMSRIVAGKQCASFAVLKRMRRASNNEISIDTMIDEFVDGGRNA